MNLTRLFLVTFFIMELFSAFDAHGKAVSQTQDQTNHVALSLRTSDGTGVRLALQLDKQIIKVPDEGSKANMGILFKDLGLYEKAIDHYKKSLPTRKKLGDEAGEATDLDNLGRLYETMGDYPNALQHYEQALAIFTKLGKADDEARILNDMGELYTALGNYPLALDCHQMALTKFRSSSLVKDEATVQNNVSLIFEKLGLYERALESHRLALAMFRKLGNPQDEAAAMLEIAATLFQMGKHDQGIKTALDALQLMKKAGISVDESAGVVAGYYLDLGRTSEAETLLSKTSNTAGLARLALTKGDYQTASSLYSKELSRLSDNRNLKDRYSAYTGLGKTYLAMKNFQMAQEAFQNAVNVSEAIRSTSSPSDRKRFFDTRINGFQPVEAYKGLALAKFRLNDQPGSLEISELLKSRRFSAYMADELSSRSFGIPRDLLSKETSLINRIAALKKELNSTNRQTQKPRHDNISLLISQSENELTSLSEELWRRYPAYASIKYPKPFRLNEITMTPNDYVIVFEVFDDGVAVQLIHDNKIIKSELINVPGKKMESDITAFKKTLDEKNPGKFDTDQASSLYKTLFQGVLEDLPEGVSLRIVSDGMLNLLPFDALVMPGKTVISGHEMSDKGNPSNSSQPQNNFLGDRYFLSLHESISSMNLNRAMSNRIRPPRNALVVADPIFSTNDDRFDRNTSPVTSNSISNLHAEASKILNSSESGFGISPGQNNFSAIAQKMEKIFPGRIILLTGAKAGKSDLINRISQNSDGFGNVMFVTHFMTSNAFPIVAEPFVALSMVPPGIDGFLRVSDILSLKMPSEIVALTGSSLKSSHDGNSGQGIADFARAFQYAGAKSVLISLRDADGGAAPLFMEKLFTYLKNGLPKRESLKRAKDELRKEGFEHPHYWSGYILYGDF